MSNNTLKKTLLTTATVLFSFGATAQETQVPDFTAPAAPENTEEAQATLDTVTVTGTRFQNPNLSSPSPISSISADDLKLSGRIGLEDALERVPSLRDTSGFGGPFDDGSTSPNLRFLGSIRTLTLVDGKRFVPSGGSSAIDINAIPQALIERVDILTGGSSAVYGADAVSGVVNFILKDDYEGVSLSGQYGAAIENWDAAETQFSILAGQNFDNDRGNATVSYTYNKFDKLDGTDRSFTSNEAFFPRTVFDDNGQPFTEYIQETANDGVSIFSRQGAIIDPFEFYGSPLNGDGTTYVPGLESNFPLAQGIYPRLLPDTEAHTASFNVHYDVNDKFRPFADIYVSRTKSENIGIPLGTTFEFIQPDNAFMSAALADATIDHVFEEFNEFFDPADPDSGPEFFLVPDIYFDRSDIEVPIFENNEADTFQAIIGAEGNLTDHLRYEISANIGRRWTETSATQRLTDRYTAAVDAIDDGNGNIVCRSDLEPDSVFFSPTFTPGAGSGCVPFNIFTTDTTINAAAIDWIWQEGVSKGTIKQDVFNGFLAGDFSPLGWSLPGGAIEYVIGAEYREASLGTKVNLFADGDVGAGDNSLGRNTFADPDGISTKEVFGELALPIFADAGAGLHELTVTGQFRYSDYDPTGADWTYNIGTVWAPTRSLSLRGSYARAVRAPTLGELYSPQLVGNFPITDPCSIQSVNLGSEFRAANCVTLLTEAGVADPASYDIEEIFGDSFIPVDRVFGGNPELQPEVGDTFTIGFIYQPENIRGMTVTLDYYDITIADAIGAVSPDFVLAQCVDNATLTEAFCASAPRDADGIPTIIETLEINVGELKTSGFEGTLSYVWPTTKWGDFNTSLAFSYLDGLTIQTTTDPSSVIDEKGVAGDDSSNLISSASEWGVNAQLGWRKGPWSSDIGLTYESSILRVDGGNRNRAIANQLSSHPELDALYLVTWSAAYDVSEQATIRMSMDNVLDEKPGIGELFRPIGPRGRSLSVGFDLDF
jgi:outer membrane receptor protein involved in Fe transport